MFVSLQKDSTNSFFFLDSSKHHKNQMNTKWVQGVNVKLAAHVCKLGERSFLGKLLNLVVLLQFVLARICLQRATSICSV